MSTKRYVVVGGGISGLSACYALRAKHPAAEIVLLEAQNRMGGVIQTDRHGGYVLEGGPDSILRRKPQAVQLAQAVGLNPIGTNPGARGAYIYQRGRFFDIPPGVQSGIPTDVWALIQSGLLSWSGKARASFDFFLPRITQPDEDIALGRFLRYRFGDEVVERLAAPMLSGIYAGDIDQMSMEATFPHFKELEQTYRSIVQGARRTRPPASPGAGPRPSLFATFAGGLQSYIDALTASLEDVDLRVNTPVIEVVPAQAGLAEVVTGSETFVADGVVIAVPANQAAILLYRTARMVANVVGAVSYANLAVIGAVYDGSSEVPSDKTGFLVPRNEGLRMTACTYVSSKWHYPDVPAGTVLRAYYGRAGEDVLTLGEQDLAALYVKEMHQVLPRLGMPAYLKVFRQPQAIPQYQVGHLRKMGAAIQQLRTDCPHVALAGSYVDGVGIPDCVRRAYAAVDQLG